GYSPWEDLHNPCGSRRGLCRMLDKAQTAAQAHAWARSATPSSAGKATPRRVCDRTGPRGCCAARWGTQPQLRDTPTRGPVLSQTRPTGVMQSLPVRGQLAMTREIASVLGLTRPGRSRIDAFFCATRIHVRLRGRCHKDGDKKMALGKVKWF